MGEKDDGKPLARAIVQHMGTCKDQVDEAKDGRRCRVLRKVIYGYREWIICLSERLWPKASF